MGEFLRAIVSGLTGSKWEVCTATATWCTPCGARCDKHAEELFAAADSDDTLLGALLIGPEGARGDMMRRRSSRVQ